MYFSKRIITENNLDRKNHNLSPANSNAEKKQVTDENVDERIELETEMKKLFESKKMLKQLKIGATAGLTNANYYSPATSLGEPDVQIIFLKKPFIQYKQILL